MLLFLYLAVPLQQIRFITPYPNCWREGNRNLAAGRGLGHRRFVSGHGLSRADTDLFNICHSERSEIVSGADDLRVEKPALVETEGKAGSSTGEMSGAAVHLTWSAL